MGKTSIEWTEQTWNPVRGCSRISPGCENCYAERMAGRFSDPGQWAHGFAERGPNGGRWTRKLALVSEQAFPGHSTLGDPLRWRRPTTVFVNSASDLFHEALKNEEIAAVFGVMAACPQHTFQILTKRAKRMREWFEWHASFGGGSQSVRAALAARNFGVTDKRVNGCHGDIFAPWPLPNVWLGISVESQQYADERVPRLLGTPAAVRWVSYEPALGPVSFAPWLDADRNHSCSRGGGAGHNDSDQCAACHAGEAAATIGWIVCGGESGPGARPFQFEWARAVRDQCAGSGVSYFFKQAGANATDAGVKVKTRARKGGDLDEIPEDLRIRQYPRAS